MPLKRKCGVLCHPTCMPGPFGIGEMGQAARDLVDFLVQAGQSIWQILPLGPTGYGDSPYQPFSAFAGNPLLISPDLLPADGLLDEADLALGTPFPADRVLYGPAIALKDRLLRRSYRHYRARASATLRAQLADFQEENHAWLDDYTLFMALKLHFGWAVWADWPADIALREPGALVHWREALRQEVDYQCYLQFLFMRQWADVKRYANEAGISIMGDVPIFMGHDSADVWSHRELFQLDERGLPTMVAGVPPDYFSSTGQLWGNPHYRWGALKETGYAWWIERLKGVFTRVDLVRLDHFRGFSGYWEVPAGEKTAINGRWVKGPGGDFFRVVQRALGTLPIIAEDLGVISADVVALREELGLPGMKVLQFAFDSDALNPALPHHYTHDCVVYTGTHDNDTTIGWYTSRDEAIKHRVRAYTGTDGRDIHWTLMRLAMNSVADTAIVPLQDVLGLGSEARLNRPGNPDDNWTWRYRQEMLRDDLAEGLRQMAHASGRWLEPGEQFEESAPVVLEYEEPFPGQAPYPPGHHEA